MARPDAGGGPVGPGPDEGFEREAELVRASTADLFALWLDAAAVRAAMRPSATLVVTDGPGRARAHGPFGDVTLPPARTSLIRLPPGAGDAFTAAIVAEQIRPASAIAWDLALQRAHAAAWTFKPSAISPAGVRSL